MQVLKFRNAKIPTLYVSFVITIEIVLFYFFATMLSIIFDSGQHLLLASIIFCSIVVLIWLIALISLCFRGTIEVSENEIKLLRGKIVKWLIKKEDIIKCFYITCKWFNIVLDPISTLDAFLLRFKLTNGKILQQCKCCLSLKQVREIKSIFNYPVIELDSVFEVK